MDINSSSPLGSRIKFLRVNSKIKQIDLANYLNISNCTLSQYELGRRTPNDEIKIKIARYFGVSLDYLFGNVTKKTKAARPELLLSDKQKELLSASANLGDEDLEKVLEYIQLLTLKYNAKLL